MKALYDIQKTYAASIFAHYVLMGVSRDIKSKEIAGEVKSIKFVFHGLLTEAIITRVYTAFALGQTGQARCRRFEVHGVVFLDSFVRANTASIHAL